MLRKTLNSDEKDCRITAQYYFNITGTPVTQSRMITLVMIIKSDNSM